MKAKLNIFGNNNNSNTNKGSEKLRYQTTLPYLLFPSNYQPFLKLLLSVGKKLSFAGNNQFI